jgi:Putative  PD-(D/E)XK family member, (DUF4420)
MDRWDLSRIFEPLPTSVRASGKQVIVITSDAESSLVVGFDAKANLILIGPQVDDFDKIVDTKFKLEPDKSFDFPDQIIDRAYKLTFSTSSELDLLVAVGVIGGVKELSRQLHAKVPSRAIIQLSRSLTNKNISEAEIGLYGELVVLLKNIANRKIIDSWHSDLEDPFDFALSNSRVEVKTTFSSQRKHWFSEAQIASDLSLDVWIASVQLAHTHSGTTCGDLKLRIEEHLDGESRRHFQLKCESYRWEDFCFEFDLEAALSSVAYFNAANLPKPRREFPEITAIKWQLDLSFLTKTPPEVVPVFSLS